MTTLIINGIMFPCVPPTYREDEDELIDNMIRIPRNDQFWTDEYIILEEVEDGFICMTLTQKGKKKKILDDYIPCLYIPCHGSNLFILYSHGNACDLGDMFYELEYYSSRFQANIFAYEYQGYGVSRGKPTHDNVKKDIKTVYHFMNHLLQIPSQNIIIFGRSIGTGPSLYLAGLLEEENPKSLGGLIIQSPFTTIRDLAKSFVGSFLSNIFVGKIFDNVGNITKVRCPTLVIHGTDDVVIPCAMGETVYDTCGSENKKLKLCQGSDHNRWNSEDDIYRPIIEFIDTYMIEDISKEIEIKEIPDHIFYKNINGSPKLNE